MRNRLPPLLQTRDFSRYSATVLAMRFAEQMVVVGVGWQVYAVRRNPLDLGLVGLLQFLPLPLLALPGGHLSDRFPRRRVMATGLAFSATIALLLLVVTLFGAHRLWPFLALAVATGCANAVSLPAYSSLTPELVPPDLLPGAIALRSSASQVGIITGPAVGGVLFALRPALVYAVAACLYVCAAFAVASLRPRPLPRGRGGAAGFADLVAGVRFVLRTRMLLGAITLDLFAVLFGGAVALLPVYARSILDVGPTGLGALRGAPAVGGLCAAILLSRGTLQRRAGPTLLLVVAIFGAAMIVFGLSTWFPLSLAALAVSGFVDMFSVNIRSSTVNLITPNELRGRVGAVEQMFLGASNELGAFESGLAAKLLGTVTAVVAGGVATICVAGAWARLFPPLARMGRLQDLRPEPV